MKRLFVYLALILPAVGLGLLALVPQADPRLAAPLFHFYMVTFTTVAATVVSLFVIISVGETALPRHLLLALSYAWMGGVFFIHGAATPGALLTHLHPAVTWSSWLTLFGGGVIFAAGAFAPNRPDPNFLRRLSLSLIAIYTLYVLMVVVSPETLTRLQALLISPAIADIIFVATLAVWLVSAWRHGVHYRETRSFVDGLMAFQAVWFATAAVSMFRFSLWQASWWLYHVLLLVGFLIASYALWRAYEQIRTFRLTRYYAATSLIITAGLALLAAQLYTNLVSQNLRQQLQNDTAHLSQYLASDLAGELSQVRGAGDMIGMDLDEAVRQRLWQMSDRLEPLNAISVFDATGTLVYSTISGAPENGGMVDDETRAQFSAAATGSQQFVLYAPGEAGNNYQPKESVYMLQTYVPLWPAGEQQTGMPAGVLMTVREAPSLTSALIGTRGAGLALAVLSMGGLFTALLAIVYRADRLITLRARQLEQAYADLRSAEGMRDDLTRMIVHDLRNPLTAITANIDLIGKTLNNPSYPDAPPRFVNGARAAGQHMMDMIDDLLNVSRFEAGELRPALTPVYLPTLLSEKLNTFQSQAQKENKVVSVKAAPELPVVMADAGLIGRVVDNLVSNAFKYTETGGCIEISAEQRGHHVMVHVRDNGQGIPPEFHARIFDKFGQVTDGNGQPLRKGTGLGLAFCRLAVASHGGQIRVESAQGQGSVFSFSLPLKNGDTGV